MSKQHLNDTLDACAKRFSFRTLLIDHVALSLFSFYSVYIDVLVFCSRLNNSIDDDDDDEEEDEDDNCQWLRLESMFSNQPIPSASNMHLFNDSFIDYSNESHANHLDQSIYLFLIITIWIVLLVTIIFGATGNLLVLYVYINRKDNKTCTFFIQVLAIVDLSICLILAPLELYHITIGKISPSLFQDEHSEMKDNWDASIQHCWSACFSFTDAEEVRCNLCSIKWRRRSSLHVSDLRYSPSFIRIRQRSFEVLFSSNPCYPRSDSIQNKISIRLEMTDENQSDYLSSSL